MNEQRQNLCVNYTPNSAAVPVIANLNIDPNSHPHYAVILHHFRKRLEYVGDFAERLEEFRKITAGMEGHMYYHVDADVDGQQFCVYNKEKNILEVRDFSYRLMMPESAWHVTETKIVRSAMEGPIERKKAWQLYRGPDFEKTWECTYNEHPRDPLHMRQGNVPCDARQLLRELFKQISSNTRLPEGDRNVLVWALHAWEVVPTYGDRPFTEEEIAELWEQCALLQRLHQTAQFGAIRDVLQALNFLTLPAAKHTLTEWVEAFDKYRNPTTWPTVLRNAYSRNVQLLGRYVA